MPTKKHLLGVAADHRPLELGSFRLGPGEGAWSRDEQALFIPVLRLAPGVVRTIASGGSTLFQILQGASLAEVQGERFVIEDRVLSYGWGDLMVFQTGEPVVHDVVLLRGRVSLPDLVTVMRYRREMVKQRSAAL